MNILEYLAEQRIKEAIDNGEFDELPGFGKPVDNSAYFSVPEEDRITFHILKNAGLVPEEVQIRKDLYHLHDHVRKCSDLTKKEKLLLKIQELENRLNFKKKK